VEAEAPPPPAGGPSARALLTSLVVLAATAGFAFWFYRAQQNAGSIDSSFFSPKRESAQPVASKEPAAPDEGEHLAKGKKQLYPGDAAGALAALAQAVADDPADASAHFAYAQALHHSGNAAEAIAQFKAAAELDPRNADYHSELAAALVVAGRKPEAL